MKARLMLVGLALLALVGCATPVAKIAQTASGRPEITIRKDTAAIKAAIISEMINKGYNLEQESDTLLRFVRPLTSGENFAAALSVGNSYSTNRKIATFTMVKQGEGVRVVVSNSITAQMPGGQIKSMEADNDGAGFNRYQVLLEELKSKLER